MAAQVPSRLYRSRSQKMIAGVCGGLGEYFDVDPVLIRLLFVVTTFISGAGILAYVVLWIVVPFEGDEGPRFDALRRDFDDLSGRFRQYVDPPSAARAGESRGEPPAGSPVGAGAPSGAATTPDPATGAPSTTQPFEEPSSMSDTTATATGRVGDRDEPPADDDLTLGPTPPGPSATGAPGFGATAEARPSSGPASDPFAGSPPHELRREPYGPAYGAAFGATSGYAAPAAPTDRKRRRQHWAGAILILIGVLILGNNLGLLWWIEPEYLLPLLLVGAGAWLLFGRGRRG